MQTACPYCVYRYYYFYLRLLITFFPAAFFITYLPFLHSILSGSFCHAVLRYAHRCTTHTPALRSCHHYAYKRRGSLTHPLPVARVPPPPPLHCRSFSFPFDHTMPAHAFGPAFRVGSLLPACLFSARATAQFALRTPLLLPRLLPTCADVIFSHYACPPPPDYHTHTPHTWRVLIPPGVCVARSCRSVRAF